MSINTLMWLLPIAFMIHDFEEIIFMKSWIAKNNCYIKTRYPFNRFPKLADRFISHMNKLSTASFAMGVAEEFILISGLTLLAVEFQLYTLFVVLTIGYFFHVIIHIVQAVIIKRYIPALGTGIITGFYNIYVLYYFDTHGLFDWTKVIAMTPVMIFLIALNLVLCHKIALRLERKVLSIPDESRS